MNVGEALLSAVVGGVLTILGTWLGARWQAAEARRTRTEQYAREDKLRALSERRELYARFARRADDGASSIILSEPDPELPDILNELIRLCWDLELAASPGVIAAARLVIMNLDDSKKDSDDVLAAIEVFLREARSELGLPMQDMPPKETWEWKHNRRRFGYSDYRSIISDDTAEQGPIREKIAEALHADGVGC